LHSGGTTGSQSPGSDFHAIHFPLPFPSLPFSFSDYIMSPLPSSCCTSHFTGGSHFTTRLKLKDAIVIGGGGVSVDRAQRCLTRYNVDIFRISEALEIKLLEVCTCENDEEKNKKRAQNKLKDKEKEKFKTEKTSLKYPLP
jgi:hypothetical protein